MMQSRRGSLVFSLIIIGVFTVVTLLGTTPLVTRADSAGYALDFDGSSQYINIGTMGTFGSSMSTNTFGYWYNSTNTANQDIVFGEVDR